MLFFTKNGDPKTQFKLVQMNNACIHGNIKQIKAFRKHVNFDNWSLIYAIQYDKLEAVKYLCENGAPITDNCMINAVHYQNFEIVKYLFEFGVPINEWQIYYSITIGSRKIARYLLYNGAPFVLVSDVCELSNEIKKEITDIVSEFILPDLANLICEYSIFFNKI